MYIDCTIADSDIHFVTTSVAPQPQEHCDYNHYDSINTCMLTAQIAVQ